MKQKIKSFLQDEEKHWVAKLECGHVQHVRHNPPWTERDWVLTSDGRSSRLDTELNCIECDELILKISDSVAAKMKSLMLEAYEAGGLSGLCMEGRFELAMDAIQSSSISEAVGSAISPLKPIVLKK